MAEQQIQIPTMTEVESSNVHSMGFSDDGLFVRFRGGATWRYPKVPVERYTEGLAASSVGSWFANHIRGHYVGERL